MERREFLIGCSMAVVAVPLGMALGGCGGGGGGTSTPASTTSFKVTSSSFSGHTHDVTILIADLTAQPAAGVTYTTTSGGSPSHTHQLFISQNQLNDINSGKTDAISTTVPDPTNHSHEFTITKPA